MKRSIVLVGLLFLSWSVFSQSITTSTITGSPFCAGAAVNVPYTISGTFTSGNIFTAQLSDATGSFASPVAIGTLTSINAGTINATIPFTTASGTAYRVRVVSSNPVTTGSNNGANLTVNALTLSAPVLTETSFCQGQTFSITYTVNCDFSNTPSNNIFTAQLSDATGSFASPVTIGTNTSVASGTISASIPGGTPAGSAYRIRIVASNPAITSATNGTDLSIAAPAGDPAIFGNNVWNVYAYIGTSYTTYAGYYTENNLSFNTTNRWANNTSPSNANSSAGTAYQGCTIANTSTYSFIHKRAGFACGYYQIDIPAHDDNVTLFIDGVQVYQHVGCCDAHTNVWTGFLGTSSTVEARVQNSGAGNSYLTLQFSTSAVPLTMSAPVTVCSGTPTTLTVSSPVTLSYAWTPAVTLTPATGASVEARPTATTTYTVTGTDATTGCTVSNSVLVTVAATPTTTIAPAPSTICSGITTITLTASGANTYTWSPATGLNTTTGNTVIVNPSVSTTYTVTGSNNCATSNASRFITVQNPPTTPTPSGFGDGTWNVYCFSGTDFSNYYGYYTENNLNFNTTSRWADASGPSVANASSGIGYTGCSVNTTFYSMSFKRTNIPCGYYQLDIPYHDDNVTLYIDGAQVFQHNGWGDVHTNVWTGFIGPASTVELRLINNSGPGRLQFSMVPSTTTPVSVNTPVTICAGTSTTLTATSAISGATYSWAPGDAANTGTVATPANASTSISPVVSDNYIVTLTDAAETGCTATNFVPVTIDPLANTSVTPTVGSTYCPGTSFTLTASGASSYTWSSSTGASGGLSATSGFQVTASPTVTTTYTVSGSNNCNTLDAFSTITINPLPAVNTYPTNTWNVYAFNSTVVGTNYSGYYTENGSGASGYDFNTTTRWANNAAPSTANATNGTAYQGCALGVSNYSLSFKRSGFTCGIYQISIPAHDDNFTLLINGTQVAQHNGCCDAHGTLWTGILESTSQVELRLIQGGGTAYLTVQFTPVTHTASDVIWTGAVSSDWFDASNWCGSIPTSATDVTIPAAGVRNMPVIAGAGAQCRNLTINGAVAAGTYNSAIAAASLATSGTFNLQVYGSWTNSGGFTANSGTVEFVGTNASNTISGVSAQTFHNLVINKTNNITISSGTQQVRNQLTLTNGIVYQNGILEILNGATVTGASNASHIDGDIRKVGNTAFIFPVGDNGYYRPIGMSAPAQATDHFTAQYFHSNPTVLYPNAQRDASLDHVSGAEYWTLNRTGGTSGVNVTLSWDGNSGTVNDLAALRVARWDIGLGSWKDQGNGGTTGTTSAGTVVTSGAVTSFSPFALASGNGNNPLPVTLLSFTGKKNSENQVELRWATANELNSDYFLIERSKNGKYFESIGSVKAAGTSTQRHDYTYTDALPFAGSSYYRLRQVDFDGTSMYSKLCYIGGVEDALVVHPNPTTDFVEIESNGHGIASVTVRNEVGYLVKVPVKESERGVILNMTALPSGIYILEVQQEARLTTHKVVVEK
ncbi:T9SS type A sorting domain-containing protein [Ohtaekwangia kribbensis]|uniref:T9SS type A sorting domain-containing protein n=1 Tax=Ohtaekwangia kribbensis TaxID=688913 RepID=A0ABW3K4F8_9BACT